MALIKVKVKKVTQEADGVRSFILAKKGLFKLPPYSPGAHIDVHCGEGVIRQYSLCGLPNDRRHFQIAVRQVDRSRGGSDLMHMEVKEGDWLEIGSPRSNFPLDEGSPYSILIAGGIGITPIIAMADRLHVLGRSFVLHYFTRAADHTAFRDRLARGEYADKVVFHEGLDVALTGSALRVALANTTEGSQVYICGPGPFMDTAQALALENLPTEAVNLERFSANPELTDTPTRAFQVRLSRTGITLDVGTEETILDVLELNGVLAPFCCEQGVCGTCVTAIVEGEADHRDSFLSPKQRNSGKLMCICVSRAKGSRVVLDL